MKREELSIIQARGRGSPKAMQLGRHKGASFAVFCLPAPDSYASLGWQAQVT